METELLEEIDEQKALTEAERKEPDPPRLKPIESPYRTTALAVMGLFVLALFYTFYAAREFFLPLTLAWILNLLLKPMVRGMKRLHIHEAIGAGIVILGIIAIIIAGAILVKEPASQWLAKAPETIHSAGTRIRGALQPATKFTKAAKEVEKLSAGATVEDHETPKVEIKQPGLMDTVLTKTTAALFLICETVVLLYFLLASGDLLMLKTIQILPTLTDKKRAVEIARETEEQVSRYLGAVSIVNAIEGTVVGFGLALVGMPNPVLWGVMAALANYIPYLGAMMTIGTLTIVSLVTFDTIPHALLPPGIYIFVNVSDNFIAPLFLGKRMVLNPLIVFLALMFWGWIWGIVGVLIAVPITMAFKIFCDHFQSLAPFGELLAGEPAKEPE